MDKTRSREEAAGSTIGATTAEVQDDATNGHPQGEPMDLLEQEWSEANEATEGVSTPLTTIYRYVPYDGNAAITLANTAQEHDNQASLEEGHVMSTIHHLQIVKTGKTSWYARKMVPEELERLLNRLANYLDSKILHFHAHEALQADKPTHPFRNRVLKMLTTALYLQFDTPPTEVDRKIVIDNCTLEARKWTMEILDRWESEFRDEVKQLQAMKTKKQGHIMLASKPGVED